MTTQECVEIIAASTIPIVTVALLVERRAGNSGIGVRAIQFLGVATLIPALVILALEHLISGEVVATLLGALVGYLFSNIGEFDRRKEATASEKSA